MKNNKVLIILVIILGILVLGLGGYVVCDKLLNTDDKKNNNITQNNSSNVNSFGQNNNSNVNDDKLSAADFISKKCFDSITGEFNCEEFDKDDAFELLNYYKMSGDMLVNDFDELQKNNVVIESINGKTGLCQDYFVKVPNTEKEVYCLENDKVEVIKYDDFLNKKKELFGSDSKLEKTDILSTPCGIYKYLFDIDSFVFAGSYGCSGWYGKSNGIIDSYEKDENLFVVVYSVSEDIDIYDIELLGYTFEKENGKYILIDVVDLSL